MRRVAKGPTTMPPRPRSGSAPPQKKTRRKVPVARVPAPRALAFSPVKLSGASASTPAILPSAPLGDATPPKLDADVIIVGAGWAGLSAARTLEAGGVSALVLEARSEVGGRVRTDTQTFSVPFDLGGAWLHSTHDDDGRIVNPLAGAAVRGGVELHETALEDSLFVEGRKGTAAEVERYRQKLGAIDRSLETSLTRGEDVAVGSLISTDDTLARAAADNYGELDMGISLDKLSSKDFAGAQMTRHDALPEGGMKAVLEADMADLGALNVKTDTPVKKVKWGPSGVEITTAAGETLHGRRVLLTVSTGVLASGKIEFDPPLPEWKREAIRALPMGLLDKVAIEFDTNVFQFPDGSEQKADDWVVDAAADGKPPMAFLMRPMGSNLAVGFVGGDSALGVEKQGDAAAVELAMGKLRKVFGPTIDQHVKKTLVTAWAKDEWTLGAYAYAKPGMAHMRDKLRQAIDDRAYFAGEATAGSENAQMLHGAAESGIEAARALMTSLERERQVPAASRPAAGPHADQRGARTSRPFDAQG